MLRCRPPYWIFGRKDPFRLGDGGTKREGTTVLPDHNNRR